MGCSSGQPFHLERHEENQSQDYQRNGPEGSLPTGAVLDMPELTARVWIAQGLAIEVQGSTTKREYAVRQASENAILGE